MATETIVRRVCDHPDRDNGTCKGEVAQVGIIIGASTYDVDLCDWHAGPVTGLVSYGTKRKGSKPRGAARIRANAPG